MTITPSSCDGVPTLVLENDQLRAEVAPSIGGRVIRLQHRPSGREFLWQNPRLQLEACAPDTPYDPNFYGGMDELLPTDLAETVNGIASPDHGELWTLPLNATAAGDALVLEGRLPRFGLEYRRQMRLEANRLVCDYRLVNPTKTARQFLWKLHAALAIQPGDRIVCPAATARAADPAWSRRKNATPFAWPNSDGMDLSVVPVTDGSTEFLFLYDLADGRMALAARDGARLECQFDRAVFPCCWYFASYGGMEGAVTGVLEPCTNLALSVPDAVRTGPCGQLAPGAALTTTVTWTVEVGQ